MTTLAGCDNGYVHTFNGGYEDQFISLFSNAGTMLWATYLGGSGSDHRAPIATDKSGNLFVSGEWANIFGGTTVIPSTYPLTNPGGGAFYSSYSGADDGFMAKFCSNTCFCSSYGGCVQTTLPHAIFVSSDTTFCRESGKCIDFMDHSTNSPTSWQWFFPGATPDTSTQQNPTNICYSIQGTYSVKLVVSNSNGSDSITVSPMITFSSSAAPQVLTFSGDTIYCSHAAAYQWYFNGSPIGGATDSFYVATMDGIYAVQITDGNGCTRLSNGFPVSVNEINGVGGIRIYPNPVEDQFTVYAAQFTALSRLEIYNTIGEKVYSCLLNSKQETINCKQFCSGIYFLLINAGESTSVKRIMLIKQ
jgi:PKD repeat protein